MKYQGLFKATTLLFVFSLISLSCVNRSGSSTTISSDNGWFSLFDGKDLSGWTELVGKIKFEVNDGTIIGTTIPNNPNSVLCTNDSNYTNFILELDVKVDSPLNSGIQVRSHLND